MSTAFSADHSPFLGTASKDLPTFNDLTTLLPYWVSGILTSLHRLRTARRAPRVFVRATGLRQFSRRASQRSHSSYAAALHTTQNGLRTTAVITRAVIAFLFLSIGAASFAFLPW
jgi:hypothetical protein